MAAELTLTPDLAIILVAAASIAICAHQTGQLTLVGYLLTGLVLGPAVLGIVEPSEITSTMAELRLAFLLFLLGVEMRIEKIGPIFHLIIISYGRPRSVTG